MITLKCNRCGREIEVSDAMRGVDIKCARCGQSLAPALPPDAMSTELGLPPVDPQIPLRSIDSAEVATDDQLSQKETMTPAQAPRTTTFAFLAPPTEAGDLGQFAHYRVIKPLGQGGMGIVFEAIDSELQRTVALKVMKPELAQDAAARQRFLREARAMAAVKSDHVTTIHQVGGKEDKLPYFAMEFLQGDSLERWLERRKPSFDDTVRLGIQIARGLAAAHEKGLIHRDIKPGNIWLEAPSGRVKILDFGLARITHDRKNLTLKGLVMGTPAYMAPEQVEGREVDARCDLFSLGSVLYELVTGKQAFTGASSLAVMVAVASKSPQPPQDLNPALPPSLAGLITRLLSKNPQGRPGSARELLEALEAIAMERGISMVTPSSGTNRVTVSSPVLPAASAPQGIVIGWAAFVALLIGIPLLLLTLLAGLLMAWHFFFSVRIP